MSASATPTAFGEIALHFPFSAELVAALKTQIPARSRRWDADEKRWLVMGAYREQAIDLLLKHHPNAEVPGDRVRHQARTKNPPTPRPLPPVTTPAAAARVWRRVSIVVVSCSGEGTGRSLGRPGVPHG